MYTSDTAVSLVPSDDEAIAFHTFLVEFVRSVQVVPLSEEV